MTKKKYRICTKCTPNHYENCDTCFGFGVLFAMGNYIPIAAGKAKNPPNKWEKCPECHSTPNGISK